MVPFNSRNREGAGRDEGDSGRHPLFKAPCQGRLRIERPNMVVVAPDREDDVSRRLKETLGEVDKALWIFSYYPDHVYGIAGTKVAPPTPTPPSVSEPANGSSNTSSVQNGSATGCQEDSIPNPKPTCLPALRAASSTASTTNGLLEPSSQELLNGLDVRHPSSHAPSKDVNNENSSVSAQKQSSVDSSFLAMHTDTKDPESESTKFSLAPKSQGLPNGLVARQPAAHAPSEDVNKDNSSISAQKQSSADSLSLTVHTETKDVETGIPKFSLVPNSQGLTSGLAVRPSTSRAPCNNANKENITGSAQHESFSSSSSLTVHEETKSPKAGVSILSVVPKSQGLPSGLVVRPPTARAPFKDVSKENSSVSTQKQLSAHYSSVGKHTETKDSEADRTRFSSVPKGQGLPSGLVVRPPTGRAPFKDVSKQNSSVLAQKQSSADSSSPMVHTETNDPKADRTKISLVPKSQVLSSILVTPAPTAGAPFMNANKGNPSALAQHESYTRKSSPTVHSERKSPEPGSTECSSMSTSSASFGQSGAQHIRAVSLTVLSSCSSRSAERAALREQARKARALRVRGLGGGDPGECPPLMSPVKVLPEQPSSTTYSSLMVHKETRDAEAGSTKFSSVPKNQRLPSGLAVRPPIARSPSKDANKKSISGSAQHHSSINYSSLMVHKETISTEAGTTKFSSVPKSQGLPSGLVVRPPTARAPCEDVNKENSSVSAQKQLSADYSSVGKHTETEDLEADRTWFSSVPKDQGLPSGLVVRPPTGRAPFKDVSKENSSVLAQKQSSANSSSPMVHTETNDPKADRTKISLVPKSQGVSSILATPAPPCRRTLHECEQRKPFRLSTARVVHQQIITYGALRMQKPGTRQHRMFFDVN
ncbi:hypothetical protein MRX96_047027 [Rhipicephalus microplus]